MITRLNSEIIEKYVNAGHWRNRNLDEFFKDTIKKNPNKVAIIDRDHRLSFSEIERLSNNLASSLRDLGISKGEVVSFELPSWYHSVIVNLALTKIGAVVNPIIPIYKEREVTFILKQAESVAMIIPDNFRGYDYVEMLEKIRPNLPDLRHIIVLGTNVGDGMISLEELMERNISSAPIETIDPNSVKLLLYTSGTTSDPKGVQHTHNTLICELLNFISFYKLNEEDVLFLPSPVTHITGYLYALELPFILGCKVVLMDKWNPDRALELIKQERCTFATGATPFLQGIINSPMIKNCDLNSLTFVCGGASITPELIRKSLDELGLRAMRAYGLSEAPSVSLGIRSDGDLEKAMNTDGLVFGNEVMIVDFDNNPLPFGEQGEIVLKGPEVFVGYRDPSLNEESFDQNGWFHTEDLGRLTPDGYLEITGRKKDIIIRGGENLSAKEIEDFLYKHPSIEVAAVVAMPDTKMGEKACAYIKLRKGTHLTFKAMTDFLLQHNLAKQKLPERLETIDEFPMTASGKIRKNELRKKIAKKLGLPPVRI